MARFWKEAFDEMVHQNRMDAPTCRRHAAANFVPQWVLFVRVCSFTFEFHSLAQIDDCLAYYSRKLHPDSRLTLEGADSWEVQRWFERLPMYLSEEPKRQKVLKALTSALEHFAAEGFKR